MTKVPDTPSSAEYLSPQLKGSDEISLVDFVRFLQRQYKIIGGITLLALLVGGASGLSNQPKYEQETLVTLNLSPALVADVAESTADLSPVDAAFIDGLQTTLIAATELTLYDDLAASKDVSLDAISDFAQVESPEDADVLDHLLITTGTARATDLERSHTAALDALETAVTKTTQDYLTEQIERLDVLIQRSQNKVQFLEEQLPTSMATLNEASEGNLLYFLQFQKQQEVLAVEITRLANYQFSRDGLAAAKTNPRNLVSVKVISETVSETFASLQRRLVLATVAGMMLGILVALAAEQMPKVKQALAESA
ncbi:MAG: hypothetical protein F6K00_18415 [Leptolyngbya sp. SIOISBB]|nr:hypothetical protein [Leptolyngbya sp. SIOISBB]